ncbi:methyltransferase domain-containing protein [Candidatus Pelagibacter sp.]|uniref:methyltransferase domain-containing protein n=1 Tax=Candidatus Pelagibacter sp. TaxID=2024849 RepID=UPI003F82B6DD
MALNKIFYNFYIALKSVNQYGILLILKSIIFEIYYSIKFQDTLFFRSDENMDNNIDYNRSKLETGYGTPNIPTPYYFLHLIKSFLIEEKINNFNFIDLGCGSGRLVNYLDENFERSFVGIDINTQIINENKNKFNKINNYFFQANLKTIQVSEDLNFLNFKINKNRKNIVFISDAIDAESIIKILPIFKKFLGKFLFIMVNQKKLDLFSIYQCKKNIFFKDKSRNISFFEI